MKTHRFSRTFLAALMALGLLASACSSSEPDSVEVGIAEDGPGPDAPAAEPDPEPTPEPTTDDGDTDDDGGADDEIVLALDGDATDGEDTVDAPDDFELNIGGTTTDGDDGTATDGGDSTDGDNNGAVAPPPVTIAPDTPSTSPPPGGTVGPVDKGIHRWTYIGVLGNLGHNEVVVPAVVSPPKGNPGTAPLTGLPITEDLNRPTLVVKIDNSPLARPQVSINEADIVFEELVESGITRFAAVYHSTSQPSIGPVRSGRSTDIAIVSSFNTPLFAFSGANSIYEVLIDNSQIINRSHELWGGYWRNAGRPAPHNLFTDSATLWASGSGTAPAPHFEFRAEGEPSAAGDPATEIRLEYLAGKSPTINYQWDAAIGGWLRWQAGTPHYDGAGVQAAPKNVIVQYVNYIDSGLTDKWGEDLYEGLAVGTGGALVFTDGKVIEATWTRSSLASVTTYTDAAGNHIPLTPGNTWIAWVPPGGANYE